MMTQRVLALLGLMFFFVSASAEYPQKILVLGTYTNFRFTEEHQYGAGVQLWQEGANLIGLFSYSQGLIGDTPTGLLENVLYDPKTGRISFSAKLTMGLHGCKVHSNVFSQDFFRFDGVFLDNSLTGTLKHSDNLHHERASTEETITLKKSDGWIVTEYPNRERWEADIKRILTFRGPKW